MSVKVAVRVRPFNSRERKLDCSCVVDMQDPSTLLKAYEGEQERRFTFDFSFWSFDQYQEQPDGYLKATGNKYADQQQVFEKIGKNILDNAWQGYHCCLFAYGQTGSGKSYSMIGYGLNKGIVPITCNDMFERIKNKQANIQYEVNASMLQIYNEEVQDLTIPISSRKKGGLKIRQNKLLGVYVDGVKKHFVSSFDQIQAVMEEGTKNRTVASTQMNATSSRAHTIITIQFKQTEKIGDKKASKISMINLVDLAGSQRSDKTGATGQRLKEAVGINQSLTTLGQVISILADNSEGANKFVPYRNSALTRILSNALGGNSQTIMICAVSPANDNYDETLSTLRYADRAKKIKNKPIVNESEGDKMIRQLKEENEKLKKMLAGKGGNINMQGNGGGMTAEEQEALKQREQELKKREQEMLMKEKAQEQRLKQLQEQLKKRVEQEKAFEEQRMKEEEQQVDQDNGEEKDQEEKKRIEQEKQKAKEESDNKHKQLMERHQQLIQQQQQQQKILQQQHMMLQKSQEDYQKFMQEMKKKEQQKGQKKEDNANWEHADDFDDWSDWSDDQKQDNVNANINYLDNLLKNLEKSKEDKKKEAEEDMNNLRRAPTDGLLNDGAFKKLEKEKEAKKQKMPPYFQNISRDVMINRKMKILLEKNLITIGKDGLNPPNDIIFGGRDITPRHATIHQIEGKVILKSLKAESHLYVNGQQIRESVQLMNLDRVVFGWNSCYLFKNKDDKKTNETIQDRKINWDFVKDELSHIVDIDHSDTEDGGSCCQIF